jgi:hypothetical protein
MSDLERLAKLIAAELREDLRADLWAEIEPALYGILEDVLGAYLGASDDGGRWITAHACSARWGRSPRWWREHAAEFGGWRAGDGPKPRIVFDPAEVERVLDQRRAA